MKALTITLAICAGALMTFSGTAHAQDNAEVLKEFDGHYVYAGGKKNQEKIDKAVEEAVADMNFVIRGFAEDKLKGITKPYKFLKVNVAGGKVTMQSERHGPWASGVDGTQFAAKNAAGDDVKVKRTMRKGSIVEVVKGDGGSVVRTFKLGTDKKGMVMYVTINSSKLDKPLKYHVAFRKK